MEKKKGRTKVPAMDFLLRRPQVLWGLLGATAWTLQQFLHAHHGETFSPLLYGKGLLLLSAATFLYHRWQAKGFFFLGMFPLLWLSLSRAQWEICSPTGQPTWDWLALFLLSEVLLVSLSDGRKILLCLAPLWVFQTHFSRLSLLLPLTFLRLPEAWLSPWGKLKAWLTREKNLKISTWGKGWKAVVLWLGWVMVWVGLLFTGIFLAWFFPLTLLPLFFLTSPSEKVLRRDWAGWGGALLCLGLLSFHGAWKEFNFDWVRAHEFFIERHYVSFLLLGWLGLGSLPRKGTLRPSVFTLFLLVLSSQFWPGPESLLIWVLMLFAGAGWESFRVNLMDDSWHGRLVWFLLGLGLLSGVL